MNSTVDDSNTDDELNWSPATKVVFTDADLIRRLRTTQNTPSARTGNWYTFFSALPKPEQERLEAAAAR
jgi:hypothetical protein